jgi:PAS domain S-box-containing protein
MPEQKKPVSGANEQALQAEIARLNKIIQTLMNRAERNASIQGSDFNLFQTAVTLEDQVRQRTVELEEARLETEKITRALRERENNHRLLLENSPVSIHEIDMDGRIISMSRAGILMHGLKEEGSMQGSLYLDGVSAADRERIGNLFARACAGETSHFEFKASGPREPIFKSSFVPIKNKSGSVEKLMGITEDITERKLAEEALQKVHDDLESQVTLRTAELSKANELLQADIVERRKAEEELKQTLEILRKSVGTTIQVMVSAVEMRDPYTAGHQIRTADLARAIATEMGLPKDKIDGIRMAGSIHDIGKLSIPAEILSKPTKLTNIEFSLIKEHPQIGYDMMKDVESPWPLAQIVYQHHERMDGSGYPRNLKGDEILLEARIMAVADVVEAMASHRPYRAALGIEAALEEIKKNKGIFYDNTVANACLRLFREKGYKLLA